MKGRTHRGSAVTRGFDAPKVLPQPHRVVVCGGGIVGLATCYYLARRGHEVVCLERETQVGMMASYKDGTYFDATLYSSWADLSLLYQKHHSKKKPFRVHPRAWLDPSFWSWGLKFMLNMSSKKAKDNMRKTRDLDFYSQRKLQELIRMFPEFEDELDSIAEGTLELFTSAEQHEEIMETDRIKHCLEYRYPLTPLEKDEASELEPAVKPDAMRLGAMFSPIGTNGDVHKTCIALALLCKRHGVMFRCNTKIEDVLVVDDHVVAVQVENGDLIEGDSFVLALGNHTAEVAKLAGVKLPLYSVKGYVLHVPRAPSATPLRCNIYAGGQALISPEKDDMIRISGGADITGLNYKKDSKRVASLLKHAKSIFPEGYLDESQMETQVCLRPVSADEVPLIGQTLVENLFINTGHGSRGWTLSFGSAALLADQISGRAPEINIEKYSPLRFGLFTTQQD
ncbi:D-amino acid dehydrogenase small subunit [Thraustotheca clavata]|uniref:D-amino acid dehydrogenase small subunit n=1 Tax=Thraustotheca clavata TaxID=74557 RepID=A0A1V9Y8H8_9STRA|nr:D-amino acid dehydrogenase small subunit [Thraustotheca clavata]